MRPVLFRFLPLSYSADASASSRFPYDKKNSPKTNENNNKKTKKNRTPQITRGEKVTVAGFGTFERRERPERSGRNPRTGEALTIAARSAPAFVAAKALKEQVDGGGEKK